MPAPTTTPIAKTSDPQSEASIIAFIGAEDPGFPAIAHHALRADMFCVEHWRIVYTAATDLHERGEFPCVAAINAFIERTCLSDFKRSFAPAMPSAWDQWPARAQDDSGGKEPLRAKSIEFLMGDILRYAQNREDHAIRQELAQYRIDWEEAQERRAKFSVNGSPTNNGKLTILTPSQILAHEDDPQDIILSNGYLEKGAPCVLCGPPGIGKSRMALQLAIKSILGEEFLGWETRAKDLKWLFLQNENGIRRLKADFKEMLKCVTVKEMAIIDANLFLHCIVSDTDGYLDLSDPDARRRVSEAIGDYKPDIVVGDPLAAFSMGDLNTDKDMLSTARDFGRIARMNSQKAIPFLIQHARTGKDAQEGVSGANRSSYARNSKALYGWTRAQFNTAPVDTDNNDRLFLASGKCNNAREFDEFIIELDLETMFYAKTNQDVKEAKSHAADGKFQQKCDRKQIAATMSSFTARSRADIKRDIVDKKVMSDGSFNTYWNQLREFNEIEETPDKKWLLK